MTDQTTGTELLPPKHDASGVTISDKSGGIGDANWTEAIEVAKVMSRAGPMIAPFMREQPGACLAVFVMAKEWRMSPFQVARQLYAVTSSDGKEVQIAAMSQLVHAIIESRAPLMDRLLVEYEGEGDSRVCIVSGQIRNRDGSPGRVVSHRSPTLGERKKALRISIVVGNDGSETVKVKGSPLWVTKPDVQLFYDTSRDFARIYFPDVLMGVYSADEMEEHGWTRTDRYESAALAQEASDGLSSRLKPEALKRAGFNAEETLATIDGISPAGSATPAGPAEAGASAAQPDAPATRKGKKKAKEGQPEASSDPAATSAPETAESSQQAPEPIGGAVDPSDKVALATEARKQGRRGYFNNLPVNHGSKLYPGPDQQWLRDEYANGWRERQAEAIKDR